MRLVILDNRSDEQAGMVPELGDGSTGRNHTNCPFVFSSREDFTTGIGGGRWRRGRLTTHELTHGADMVIRQLIDPFFHFEAAHLFDRAMERRQFHYDDPTAGPGEPREVALYAACNRDEYIGECVNIILNLSGEEYHNVGITGRADLEFKDPAVCALLRRFFTVPASIEQVLGAA